jgi:hypothetical protein
MKHGSGVRSPHSPPAGEESPVDVLESGIVPARARLDEAPTPAVTLRAHRDDVTNFGSAVSAAGDILIVGSRRADARPFAALYRVHEQGVVRERLLAGAEGHRGPSLATDGARVAVGQPGPAGGLGFVSVYRREGADLTLETTLEAKPDDPAGADFGQVMALERDLLVLGQAASVCVYRHSVVGWLSAGTLQPPLPYEWNPALGQSVGVVRGLVLAGNPVEIEGHRAGPGRVFVYRQHDDHMALEGELLGDGIEGGREEPPRPGFGACIQVSGEFVVITAPGELSSNGALLSRVYVYRVQGGQLVRFASVDVAGCEFGACLVGERLFVLGEALHVFARAGNSFTPLASYPVAAADKTTLAACGKLLALASAHDAGEVALHFAEQL